MKVALALVLSAAYGAGTQFLGTRVHGWGLDVAQLSAPWLAIAFVGGWTQRTPRRGAALGLGTTAATLVGYWLMTDSPLEGAQYTLGNARGFFLSNAFVVVGGLVTGPLFGWLGQRWRERRAVVGALAVAVAFCLEPLARHISLPSVHVLGVGFALGGYSIGSHTVVLLEVATGLVLATAVLVRRRRQGLSPEV